MPKVRDAIRLVEHDGWFRVHTTGSHRQFRHPEKSGTVTIAGHPSTDIPPGTWLNILRQAGIDRREAR